MNHKSAHPSAPLASALPAMRVASDTPVPPLPTPVPVPLPESPVPSPQGPFPFPHFRLLRGGCYLIRYTPTVVPPASSLHYNGTLRVEHVGANTIASGDLYIHPSFSFPFPFPFPEPNPALGIPIFARSRYRYYLRITQILEFITFGNSFTLGFDRYRFDQATSTWTNEGSFTAVMSWTSAPAGYPSSADYLTGEVRDAASTVVGTLTMGWVSAYLRRATLEIDRVSASESPLDNGMGVTWRTIFDQVGWDLTVVESNADVVEPSGESWSNAEMHAAMLARRDSANLDREWRYHVLCVRKIDVTPRGIMYDSGGTDSNNIPREGAGIASHWIIPNADPWGLVKGVRFGTATGPYFRTAVHEIGHAMGLYHNTADLGIMNTTDVIAASAVAPVQFPNNIQWGHAADDQKRLRHMPDQYIRPGGTPFGTAYGTTPISPDDLVTTLPGLDVQVTPLRTTVPIGAPVRVSFKLVNHTEHTLPAPASLSLKSGAVQGKVIDPTGAVRTFKSVIICVDDHPLKLLKPGQSRGDAMTLLRGAEGALFPIAGVYRIVVDIEWDVNGSPIAATGETTMMVTPVVNENHAQAALTILSSPDSLLTLAIGGDHLPEGIAAIQAGLDDPILRPHYAIVEARRIGQAFGKRKADPQQALQLLDETTVMTGPEIHHAAALVKRVGKEGRNPTVNQFVKVIQAKVTDSDADDETVKLVKGL
jgi:hypothetical protein